MGTVEQIMSDVTPEELEIWSGAKRKKGWPSASEKESYGRRKEKLIGVTLSITEGGAQTLRHCYYRVSALGLVGKDHGKETHWYSLVAQIIGEARWAGIVGWERIADDSRTFTSPVFWDNAAQRVRAAIDSFAIDLWKGQKKRVLIVSEKDAILTMLAPIASELQVPLLSCHGQASDGAIHNLGGFLKGWHDCCEDILVFYFGDHDGAGTTIDRAFFGDRTINSKDLTTREQFDKYYGKLHRWLNSFGDWNGKSPNIFCKRLGATFEDVQDPQYEASILLYPHTKKGARDTFYERYMLDTNGDDRTLGVDALSREELTARARAAVISCVDQEVWNERIKEFEKEKARMEQFKEP